MKTCGKKAQGKVCDLELYHDGVHIDSTGFKFIDKDYPDLLGNGPSGYPMNNRGFDKAVKKLLDSRKEDIEQAEEFMRKLDRATSTR